MDKEEKILGVMNRLGLKKTENGLTTYMVLEEIWDEAAAEARQEAWEDADLQDD